MMTAEQVAEKVYPAILRGKRVIIPGFINQFSVLLGKLLPFPWAIKATEFTYNQSIIQTVPTYPLQASGDEKATRSGAGGEPGKNLPEVEGN